MALVEKTKEEKRQLERWSAEVFLTWYNKHNSTDYTRLKETCQKFPELSHKKNWDFVAESVSQNSWIAIDCKGIWHSQSDKEASTWRYIFETVNQRTKGKLRGNYWILSAPDLRKRIDQKYRNELIEAIYNILLIIDKQNLKSNEYVNIWPDVYKELNNWPVQHQFGIRNKLQIIKRSETNGGIRIVSFSPHQDINEEEIQSIKNLFKISNMGYVKADSQLAMAKRYGAKKTILIIDGYSDLLKDVTYIVESVDDRTLVNIDSITLVDKEFDKVHIIKNN